MRTIDILLDSVVFLAVFAAFLPFLLQAHIEIQNIDNYGFDYQEDKTMQQYKGDSDISSSDAYSAAEVLLSARVMDYPAIDTPDWILPNGQHITVDLDYNTNKGSYTTNVRGALSSNKSYQFRFDYIANAWRVVET